MTKNKQKIPVGWEKKRLGYYCSFLTGGTPKSTEELYYGGDINWLVSGDIHKKKIFESTKKITKEGLLNSSAKILPINSVLIALNGQGKTRGTVAVLKTKSCCNQSLISINSNDKKLLLNEYIFVYLDNEYISLRSISGENSRNGLSKTLLEKYLIKIPKDINEQKAIADVLTKVDESIERTQVIVEKAKLIKKGLMQKIFNQTIRFKADDGSDFPDWQEERLGLLCKVSTGKLDANARIDDGKYRFYTCAKEYYKINEYEFDTDALIVSGNGANVGYIHHYQGKFNAYQRTYVLDKFGDNNIIFIKFVLDEYLHKRITKEKKDGNTPYILIGTLTDMKINIPSFLEQTKIADMLTKVDKNIEKYEEIKKKKQTVKKGLMQDLLTGQVRFKEFAK